MNLVTVLRWLLALLSAPFGFHGASYVGALADGFVAKFCPPEGVVSGLCTTNCYLWAGDAIILGAVQDPLHGEGKKRAYLGEV